MTSQEFVKKFNLDRGMHFNRPEFISEFHKDFLEKFEAANAICKSEGKEMPFDTFKGLVSRQREFFWEISSKRKWPFTEALWKLFYATKVVPVRARYFPDMEKKIKTKRSSKPDYYDKLKEIKEDMEKNPTKYLETSN